MACKNQICTLYKTYLGNQMSCKLQPQLGHQGNLCCLHHKQKKRKLDSSIENLGRMMLNTGSTLPMGANFPVQLEKNNKSNKGSGSDLGQHCVMCFTCQAFSGREHHCEEKAENHISPQI